MSVEQNVNAIDLAIENLRIEASENGAKEFWAEPFSDGRKFHAQNFYSLMDFIKFSGETFICKLYMDLYGRVPTPAEYDLYLAQMQMGTLESKLEIIRSFLTSETFKSQGKIVKISGLTPVPTNVWNMFQKISSKYVFFFCMLFYVHGILSKEKMKYYFRSLRSSRFNRYDWAYLMTFVPFENTQGRIHKLISKTVKSLFRFLVSLHPRVWFFKNVISNDLIFQLVLDQENQIRSYTHASQSDNFLPRENSLNTKGNNSSEKAGLSTHVVAKNQSDNENVYFEFENQFRGSQEMIFSRLKTYLPLVKPAMESIGSGPALDIGFGRGEWLSLLKQEGLRAVGVDSNSDLVQRTKDAGFDVFCADGIDYLSQCAAESFSVITAFHVVEHLPLEKIHELIKNSLRSLKSGGVLILETPNPENIIVGSYEFWMDPTHQKPIPAPVLHFFVNAHGFKDVQTIKKNSVQTVNPDGIEHDGLANIIYRFNLERDYAIFARKQ
jgi:SAM-dependent methyltransferase